MTQSCARGEALGGSTCKYSHILRHGDLVLKPLSAEKASEALELLLFGLLEENSLSTGVNLST